MKWVFDRHKKANIKASSVKSCHKVDLPQKGIKLQPPTPKHFISFALYYFNCRFSSSASEMENAWRQLMAFMKWLMSAYTVMWFINAWMCALWFHFLPTYCAFSRIFFDKEKLTWIFYANGIVATRTYAGNFLTITKRPKFKWLKKFPPLGKIRKVMYMEEVISFFEFDFYEFTKTCLLLFSSWMCVKRY